MQKDNDMIDEALDRALDQLEEKEKAEPVELESKTSTEEIPDEIVEETTAITPPEAENQEEQVSDQLAEAETGESGDTSTISMPTFWSAELRAAAAKGDAKMVQLFIEHEQQREDYVRRVANENQRGKEFEKQMYADLGNDPQRVEAHRASLRLNGIRNEVEELHRYRAWDTVFKSDVESGVIDLMKKNNLTPEQIYETFYGESGERHQQQNFNNTSSTPNAEVEELKREIQAQKDLHVANEVNSFKMTKDADGRDRKVFVETYAPQITEVLAQIQERYPHFSLSQALEHSYDHVMTQVKQLHGLSNVAKKAPSVDVKKAQAASSSMSGSPVAGTVTQRTRLKGKNFNEKIDSAIDLALDRAGF